MTISDPPIAAGEELQLTLGDGVLRIYGGRSPYTAADPFELQLPEEPNVGEAVRLMGVLAGKGWGATPGLLLRLADLVLVGREKSAPQGRR